jgi:hypothetical protein
MYVDYASYIKSPRKSIYTGASSVIDINKGHVRAFVFSATSPMA